MDQENPNTLDSIKEALIATANEIEEYSMQLVGKNLKLTISDIKYIFTNLNEAENDNAFLNTLHA